jgi:hypothetical protein
MDVQADKASVKPDPSPTIAQGSPAVPTPLRDPRPVHQGSFFQDDPYPTFAHTDPTPAVVGRAPAPPQPKVPKVRAGSPGLRFAVWATALAVVAAGTALALVETGVISTKNNTSGGHSAAPPPATHTTRAHHGSGHGTGHGSGSKLLTPSGLTPTSASYTVDASAYGLTITTSTGRSWVSVGSVGQHPIFAGIIEANSSQHVTVLGPTQLEIGAGGTKVVVTSDRRTQTLTPPSAPFSYQFTPR